MGFSQALSGLNAAADSLDVLGNNIANSQTVGYKSGSAQFADVFANSQIGLGTKVSTVLQDFSGGNLESTNRPLDLGISGDGFFRMEQNGQVVYSRNGQLTMTPDGYLQNAQGARIMGYGVNAAGQVQVGGQPEVLQVEADEMPASATTEVATTFNLDSRKEVGVDTNSVTLAGSGGATNVQVDYHYSNNFTAYDSLGNPRNVTVYYEKTGPNTWTGTMAMDGKVLMDGATPSAPQTMAMEFDENGQLTAPANGQFAMSFASADYFDGAATDMDLTFDISGSTQFGNSASTTALNQNGYTSGALVGISIQDDGTVVRSYSNEQTRPAGQIALANFRNPEGLSPAGDNTWAATDASGQELVGAPGTGLLGGIQSGAIETSNVDMAKELVSMIVTQRAYQANSQTIKTQDEVLQTAINLR
ncbi:flagellar hook protein FlgE [Halomonas denitrificans]|uniref:flagellar hook protein FlgE n=1 Tax=Halomonas TaxID=2745 RepID=UPI001C95CD6E|nr:MULTISPECIES: flagellar hook protein FlgE [Halomonas]MBY5967868.1 flagellar hook protein FlgE [Halomonas denitrificans]MBY5983370.1 flagellar hook protein FlgE [Halomonas sp. DP5Y7-2]MBY6206172.1 flagellar hook protein FlgE [Halomonas sp. DP3Y7-2]MBY6227937.1 flagellar hook protein FlgE [Halomonas sp. DP3Y7-1]MCA0916004.1 flagellar hook protein FlgE [Halomonas denitrificans]